MAWLPDCEKNSKISLFVLIECTNVTDTRTDRQTPHDDTGRACIASRGKNNKYIFHETDTNTDISRSLDDAGPIDNSIMTWCAYHYASCHISAAGCCMH